MRPHQYIKNLFIFAPLLFTFQIGAVSVMQVLYAFMLFSIMASGVYIYNDLKDIEADKLHPTKKNRPLASGQVSISTAKKLIYFLTISPIILAFFIDYELSAVLLAYLVLNIFYSLGLKHIAILDIFIISTGFVLRLFAGSAITNITLSMWIIIITFLLAIFLALAKRRDDVILSSKGMNTRKNINGYNLEFVNAAMVLMAGVVTISYIQYTISSDVIERIGTEYLYITSFFVVLGILRYMQITFVEQQSGSPTKIVAKDTFLKSTVLFWLVSFIGVVALT